MFFIAVAHVLSSLRQLVISTDLWYIHNISLYKNYVFYCCCSCAFLATATDNFHRLMAFISISLQIFWQKFFRNVPWVDLYHTYEFRPNRWIWLVAMATERINLRKNIKKSEAIRGMKLKLCRNVHNISLYKIYVFYCRCSYAFIAMAT